MTDQTSGEPKGLKHAVICAGVERLIEDKGWERKKVMLWIDWQSVYQDRDDEKDKALRSLVKYATSCKAMLIPTDYGTVAEAPERVEQIRGYGTRGFCRLEVLVYALWRAIRQGGFHAFTPRWCRSGRSCRVYGPHAVGSISASHGVARLERLRRPEPRVDT